MDDDKDLYRPVIEMISRARHSIRVVGMYRSPDLSYRKGRSGYYEAIEEKLDLQLRLNQAFVYERIVQVEQVTSGRVTNNQIDPVTFKHCRKMLELRKNRSPVAISLKQLPSILGALSFLIVDDNFVVLVIPDTVRDNSGQLRLEGLQLSINMDDLEGVLAEPMKSYFSRLLNEAEPILSLDQI